MTFWLWLISTADFLHFLSCPVVSNFSRSSGLQHPEGVPVYLALRLYGGGKSKKAATQVPPDKGLQDLLANSSEAGPFHQLLGCLIINTKVDDHFSDKRPFNEQAPYFLRRLLGKPHKRKGFASGTWVDVLARHPDGPAPSFQLEDRATWGLEGKLGAPHLVSSQICVCVSQPWCCGFHIKMAQTISFDPSPNRFQLECNQHFFQLPAEPKT